MHAFHALHADIKRTNYERLIRTDSRPCVARYKLHGTIHIAKPVRYLLGSFDALASWKLFDRSAIDRSHAITPNDLRTAADHSYRIKVHALDNHNIRYL